MKIIRLLFTSILAMVILQGCGNAKDNQNANNLNTDNVKNDVRNDVRDTKEDVVEDCDCDKDDDESLEKIDIKGKKIPFSYEKFDLDVEYPNQQSYEVEFKKYTNTAKVEIEDEIHNKKIYGEQAFNDLKPILEKVNINESTTNDEVIKQVLKEFNLKTDYKHFKLKVRYKDGTEKKYTK